jgi:putative ribosome biogenesis GTPase RsgA
MTLISSFLVPENEVTDLGLKEIRMSRLGRMVALAGKNGAGKSRILNRLDQIANHRYQNLDSIAGHRSTIARNGEALQVNPNSEYARAWKDGIEQSKQ